MRDDRHHYGRQGMPDTGLAMNTHHTLGAAVKTIVAALLAVALLIPAGPVLADSYTVQPGDNLYRLAIRYGTTVDALIAANKTQYPCLATQPTCLQAGWVITVPGPAGAATATGPGTYVVRSGDSLARIARNFGLSLNALITANKGTRPCLANPTPCPLQIGWTLTIPGGTAAATSAAAPLNTPQSVFAEYVAALNARDAARLKATIHPGLPNYADLDDNIAELFVYANGYEFTYQLISVRVLSQTADSAQVVYRIDGASGNFPDFTSESEYEVTLKIYQGQWRIFHEEAGMIEFTR